MSNQSVDAGKKGKKRDPDLLQLHIFRRKARLYQEKLCLLRFHHLQNLQ
jgi:hypothetical protein